MIKKTYIIAEIGPNHNGSFQMAKKMISLLKGSGVDAIKFQLANPEKVYSKNSFKADYQIKNTNKGSIKDMSRRYQLSKEDHLKLANLCRKNKIDYLCSAFDKESLEFLVKKIKVKYIKVPSGEITSLDILNYISKLKKKIILSTGMASIGEIKNAIKKLNKKHKQEIVILHCVSSYPTDKKDLNLNIIKEFQKIFKIDIGFSDHSLGNEASLAAVALGAKIIEKHVTISKKMIGPDHSSSSSIKEFYSLVKQIRELEKMLGTSKKKLLRSEKNTRKVSRKSIVANKDLMRGKILKTNDIVFKRPGTGISPMNIRSIIGKKLKKNIPADNLILMRYLKK
tara:strand:+ start:180 stop:1196 length:1017 start_codon:yes stop_codon:yes gene_type:complete